MITTAPVYEDGHAYLLARVVDLADGAVFVQADVSAISLKVYDEADPTSSPTHSGTLTVATVILNTPATDLGWANASAGYNLKVLITPAMVPAGSKTYRFEFTFTTASGHTVQSVIRVPTIGLYQG